LARTFVPVKLNGCLFFARTRGTVTNTRTVRSVEKPEKGCAMQATKPSPRQLQILEVIEQNLRDKGYPPSVREIGDAVGLTSPSTVHTHLKALERMGFIHRDPSKPRAIEVRYDPNSGVAMERRPVGYVPLIGMVAAGTDVLAEQNVEEIYPLPSDFTGHGELFMLKVRGDSMIDVGIFDGDYVVARAQNAAMAGEIIIAGIPGEEATIKTFGWEGDKIKLIPANPRLEPMLFERDQVRVFGKVVTVMRCL